MAITRARTSSVAQGPSTRKTVLGGNDVILGGSYDAIGTAVVGAGGQSTITFSSIPSTYKHLQVRISARTNRAATVDPMNLRFNSDSGSSYAHHAVYGDGASTAAEGLATQTGIKFYRAAGNSATSEIFGMAIVDILDYANTSKNKTVRYLGGIDQNGSGEVFLGSGLFYVTNAITTLTITPFVGTSFNQYSQFDLYGIK
jgi:hypothetical protein